LPEFSRIVMLETPTAITNAEEIAAVPGVDVLLIAESRSLARIRFRRSRTPAFRAGMRGWHGDRVGRDAQGVSISRQLAAISLSGHIPVPQCR
jgi:hypothetical protein